jgi:hypothetical protein
MSVAHESSQDAEHLVLATEVGEFARKEHGIAPPAGDPALDLLA